MAFFDKLSAAAKSASDKGSNLIETTKLNGKISAEEKNISNVTFQIGAYIVSQLDAGNQMDDEVAAMYAAIVGSRQVIDATRAEIEALKAPKPAEYAPQQGYAPPQQDFAPAAAPAGGTKFCSECGAKLNEGARFCNECGAKLQ